MGSLAVVTAVLGFLTGFGAARYRQLTARALGSTAHQDGWAPAKAGRASPIQEVLERLRRGREWPLYVASASGEELGLVSEMGPLRDLLVDPQGAIKVLLAHPDSAELRRTCEGYALDLGYVRQQIVERTRWLLREGNGRCEVRWYLSPPAFRIVATSAVMHFAPLVEGAGGSAAGSSVLEHGSPFYESAMRWFEGVWVSAVDAAHELEWAERDVLRNRAIFLDRDDTLIKDMAYASSHRDAPVVILPGVVEGLQRLSMAGYRLIVVSNQQAVGINAQTHEDLGLITQHIKAAFDEHGIHLDAFYYCTHAVTQQCNCRKPKPQLFLEAARRFCLDLAGSHFIGDADSDRDVAIHLPQMRVHVVDPPRGFAAVVEEILSSHPL